MARKLIDLSVSLGNDVAADPPGYGPKMEYYDHLQTAPDVVKFFPGLKVKALPMVKAAPSNG
jgi:hypothetical protein